MRKLALALPFVAAFLVVVGVSAAVFTESFPGTPPAPLAFSSEHWETIFAADWGAPLEAPNFISNVAQHGPNCEPPGHDGSVRHTASTIGDLVFQCADHVMTHVPHPDDYSLVYMTPDQLVDLSGPAILRFDVSTLSRSDRDWIDIWVQAWDTQEQRILDTDIPTNNGNPRNALHIEQGGGCGGFTSLNGDFHVEVYNASRGKVACIPGNAGWSSVLTPSAQIRSTVEIALTPGHVKVWMPALGHVLAEGDIPALGFTEGVVTFGHHSYSAQKGTDSLTGGTGTPNTWHWDNVTIDPAIPFTIRQPNHRAANWEDSAIGRTFSFAPAPAGAVVRFEGWGQSFRISANGGSLLTATRTGGFSNPNTASSYVVAVPEGTTSVLFEITPSSGFIGQVSNPHIFARGTATPTATPTPTVEPPPTPTATPTPTVTPTPTPTPERCRVQVRNLNDSGWTYNTSRGSYEGTLVSGECRR